MPNNKSTAQPGSFRLLPALATASLSWIPLPADAGDDYIVYSPRVTQGQSEIEMRGFNTRDADPAIDRTGIFGVAYAPTAP